jgi:chorismate mutase
MMKAPIQVAGPCSAESAEQVMQAASGLASCGLDYFRAGIWKPRTKPGAFEGVGNTGLPWLQEVQRVHGMKVCTEVANVRHVEAALEAGIDMLWIGARTTANPFQIQEIADALRGVQIPVAVKNPTQPDLALWSGAIERLQNAGIQELMAVHRGFTVHGQKKYRNVPLWQIPIDFRNEHPEIPLLNDPSHITGRRDMIPDVAQMAADLGFDGFMIEVHPDPDVAWTDAAQQITPERYVELLEGLVFRSTGNAMDLDDLTSLRSEIDMIDEGLVELLVRRMGVSKEIGRYKGKHGMTILQNARWTHILKQNVGLGEGQGLSPDFIKEIYKAIHQASIAAQRKVIGE